MSRPTSAVKRRYNKAAYSRYEFSVKIDTKLNYLLEKHLNTEGSSLSALIKSLLCNHFGVDIDELYIPYHFGIDEHGHSVQIRNDAL